jgi:hypothetical protein
MARVMIESGFLCRRLCPNPGIPAHIAGSRVLSFSDRSESPQISGTRLNTAS